MAEPIKDGHRTLATLIDHPSRVLDTPGSKRNEWEIDLLKSGREFPLTIGRGAYEENSHYMVGKVPNSSDLGSISRVHCEIDYNPDLGFTIEDMSKNGTWIKEDGIVVRRLIKNQARSLRDGDKIYLGDPEEDLSSYGPFVFREEGRK